MAESAAERANALEDPEYNPYTDESNNDEDIDVDSEPSVPKRNVSRKKFKVVRRQKPPLPNNVSYIKPNTKRGWRVAGAENCADIIMQQYCTYDEAYEAFEQYCLVNCAEFSNKNTTMQKRSVEGVKKRFERNTCIFIDDYQMPRIRPIMKFTNDTLIPFVPIGLVTKQCRHASVQCAEFSKNFVKLTKAKKIRDRFDCCATAKILQVAFFPEYEILVDTDEYRKIAVEKIREAVQNDTIHFETKFYLGISENHNHVIGPENANFQRLDPRLREEAEKLINDERIYDADEIMKILKHFVEGLITAKAIPRPQPNNSRFYPDLTEIKSLRRSVFRRWEKAGKEVPTPPYGKPKDVTPTQDSKKSRTTQVSSLSVVEPEKDSNEKTSKSKSEITLTEIAVENKSECTETQMRSTRSRKMSQRVRVKRERLKMNKRIARAIGCLPSSNDFQRMTNAAKYRTLAQLYLYRIGKRAAKMERSEDLEALSNSLRSLHDEVKPTSKSLEGKPKRTAVVSKHTAVREFHFTPSKNGINPPSPPSTVSKKITRSKKKTGSVRKYIPHKQDIGMDSRFDLDAPSISVKDVKVILNPLGNEFKRQKWSLSDDETSLNGRSENSADETRDSIGTSEMCSMDTDPSSPVDNSSEQHVPPIINNQESQPAMLDDKQIGIIDLAAATPTSNGSTSIA